MKNYILPLLFVTLFVFGCAKKGTEKTEKKTEAVEEFICIGNEPFWSLEVKSNGLIFTESESEIPLCVKEFDFYKGNDSIIYTSKNLSAIITKENCSDTMSDFIYEYKTTVSVNGKEFNGCAKLRTLPKIKVPYKVDIKHPFSDVWSEDLFEITLNNSNPLKADLEFKISNGSGVTIFNKNISSNFLVKDSECFNKSEFDAIDSARSIITNLNNFLIKDSFVRTAEYKKNNNLTDQELLKSEWLFLYNEPIDSAKGFYYSQNKKQIIEF